MYTQINEIFTYAVHVQAQTGLSIDDAYFWYLGFRARVLGGHRECVGGGVFGGSVMAGWRSHQTEQEDGAAETTTGTRATENGERAGPQQKRQFIRCRQAKLLMLFDCSEFIVKPMCQTFLCAMVIIPQKRGNITNDT